MPLSALKLIKTNTDAHNAGCGRACHLIGRRFRLTENISVDIRRVGEKLSCAKETMDPLKAVIVLLVS